MRNFFIFIGIIFIMIISSCIENKQSNSKESSNDKVEVSLIKSKLNFEDDSSFQVYNIIGDSTVECEQGTIIEIDIKSFETNSKSLILRVKEYYDISSMVLDGLSTKSGYDLLETGGMLYIQCIDEEGEEVNLKTNENIKIGFKSQSENRDSMNLFYGENVEGYIDWKVDSSARVPQMYYIRPESPNGRVPVNKVLKEYDFFNSSNLGWLNLDRFISLDSNVNLNVRIKSEKYLNGFYVIVSKKYNSISHLKYMGNLVYNIRLPKNQDFTIVGLEFVEDLKYNYFIKDFNTSKNQDLNIQIDKLSPSNYDTIKGILNQSVFSQ